MSVCMNILQSVCNECLRGSLFIFVQIHKTFKNKMDWIIFIIAFSIICIIIICYVSTFCFKTSIEAFSANDSKQILKDKLETIDNKNDFYDFCEWRLGTRLFNELKLKPETKLAVIEEYNRGVDMLKDMAQYEKIPITGSPKYGMFIKQQMTLDNCSKCFQ